VAERLDEEQVEILRTWGAGLEADTRAELRAAGKAILILIAEVERLRVDTPHARIASNTPLIEASSSAADQEPIEAVSSQSLGTSLRERLGAVIPGRATSDQDA
jgi:GTP:adenosylcobinamide-phosphate guanylyltransferase